MQLRILVMILGGVLFATGSLAGESRFQQFLEDVAQAYGPYRMALLQTNKHDGAQSLAALQEFCKDWLVVVERYGAEPPEIFSDDPEWSASLAKITAIAAKAEEEVEAGKLDRAHETLEAIRDALGDLRQRNSVIVFSDHVNHYHAVMEGMLNRQDLLSGLDAKANEDMRGQWAVLVYLAGKMRDNAPANLRVNPMYQKLEKGLFESLQKLHEALVNGESDDVKKAIQGLKPAYSKLFVQFG